MHKHILNLAFIYTATLKDIMERERKGGEMGERVKKRRRSEERQKREGRVKIEEGQKREE